LLLSVADPPPPPPQLMPRKETAVVGADCYSSDDDLMFRPVATKRGKKKGGRGANRAMEESLTDFEGWKVSVVFCCLSCCAWIRIQVFSQCWGSGSAGFACFGPPGSGSISQRYGSGSGS
jgi:hypothetical protein